MSLVCLTIAGVKIDLIASKFLVEDKLFYKWKNEIYKKKICVWNKQYICEILLRNIIY